MDDTRDRRRWRFPAALLCATFAAGTGAIHCGAGDANPDNPGDQPSSAGDADASASADSAASAAPGTGGSNAVDGNASGVITVHASGNLPAFRLCFGNDGAAGNLVPFPDRELMPQSNVVGVDVGSAVRLRPLADVGLTINGNGGKPHTVYVIPEKYLRPPVRPANTPCSALICPGLGGDCLDANQFTTLGTLPPATYEPGVHLLVVSGCVPGSGDAATCGPDFDAAKGNAKVASIELSAYTHTPPRDFLVQIANLSPSLAGPSTRVTFGDLGADAGTPIDVSPTLGAVSPAAPVSLALDRADSRVYASHGFRVETTGLAITQSLASVQALSAPQALPQDFYSAQSNFVLLLLGNPADTAKTGGPLTPTTDPGKVIHLLGVPVAAPYDGDGGVDSGPYDASRGDAADAGPG